MRKKRSYNSKISSFEIILFFEWMSKTRPEKSSSFFESSLNKSIDTLQGLYIATTNYKVSDTEYDDDYLYKTILKLEKEFY